MVVLYEHSVKTVSLTLLKEDACNIEVVVVESNLERSVTSLHETVGDTRKREWKKCTLTVQFMFISERLKHTTWSTLLTVNALPKQDSHQHRTTHNTHQPQTPGELTV